MPGMPPAYQGQGYCKQPGQGHGGDQGQLYQQQQQQIYNMRAAGYMSQMGGLPRQPYPAGGQYGLTEAPPRYPSSSAMCRPNAAAAAAAAAAVGDSDSSYGITGLSAPVHHHLRNARSSQNPQLVADNILHMASATYPCNGPQVIPPGINKFHTPRMASPKHMMSAEAQMAMRQPMGVTSGQFDMNHMSPTSGKGNPAAQMWPNSDGCCSGPMPCTPHQMSPHMAQQDSCYGNQFVYGAKPNMMSPDTGHMMSPDPGHMMSPDPGHMMSPDGGHMMSPDSGHMMPIRSPSASIQSGPSVSSVSPGPMCSPATVAGSLCSPHTDQSPASITSPALRSPAGQSCVQSTMMHLQHGSQLPMSQQPPQHYMPTDQYAMYPPYSQPYQPCGQPVSSGQGFGVHQSNPLQSLQKLVMLPESQVVNPKSVVSEACLSDRGDGAGTAAPPGKRKRCSDGVHCGSEDETEPLGPRTDQVDQLSSVCETLPDMSYFPDTAPYSVVDAVRPPAVDSPSKAALAKRRQRQNKKARSALGPGQGQGQGQDGVNSVSLTPNLNCSPVAGTGQPERALSHALSPRSVSDTQSDMLAHADGVAQTHVESVTQTRVESVTQTRVESVTQAHVQGDTQTYTESVTRCHSVADVPHHGDLPVGSAPCTRADTFTGACSSQAGLSNCLITSVASSTSSNSVKGERKTKKSRNKKHAKSMQQCPTGVDCATPCGLSTNTGVTEGTTITPGNFPMERGMGSASREHDGAGSSCTTGEKQECDNLGRDSELSRISLGEGCGSVQSGSVEQVNNSATNSYKPTEEPRVKVKQTTTCSPTKDIKVKGKMATNTPGEEGLLNTTGGCVEQGSVHTKGRATVRKLKVVTITDSANDTSKCSDTLVTSTGREVTKTPLSVGSSKSPLNSHVSAVTFSSPLPMRPQQVDLTKIGKDISGRAPKTSSRRATKVNGVEDTTVCDNSLGRKNGDLTRCDALAKLDSTTVQQKSVNSSPSGDDTKSKCSTREGLDQKSETLQHGTGTLQSAAPRGHDPGDPVEEKHLLECDYLVKNNGLFMDNSNCKTPVQRTKRKRRKNTEKQIAEVKIDHKGTTIKPGPESPGCVVPTDNTKDVTTGTAVGSKVGDEDDLIHVKRESAKKVYGRSPDKKTLANSSSCVSTSPDKKVSPSDDKKLPSDEKLLSPGKTVLTPDDKVLLSDKNETPSDDKLLLLDEKVLLSDEKLLPSDETSSSNDCVAEAECGEPVKVSVESLQASGRGKRKRVPNRYFNFDGQVIFWDMPAALKRKRIHKGDADNTSGKAVNHKEPRLTKTIEASVDRLRQQKADIVDQLLQSQSGGKRTKNGVLKALSAVDSLSLDDELPLSVLCKKKPVATVLPLTSVQSDRSPRKCLRQKQQHQSDEKVTRDDPPTRQRQADEKHMTQDEPPTCIDIVTLVSEEPPEHDDRQTDSSEREVDEMEVEEVEEEEYVLCPDTCQTLDLFVPDALDAGSEDKRSEMEVIDCDSDSERPDIDPLLDDTAAFSDDSVSPSHPLTLLTGKTTDAIYIISSSEDEREPDTGAHATDRLRSLHDTGVTCQKGETATPRDDPTPSDTGQTGKARPKTNITAQCKDQRSRGAKPRGARKKTKRKSGFDYDDDSADERLKNHLTKAFSGSQSGKGSKTTSKDRGSSGGLAGPYVRLKGCKETPLSCEVVSLANDDMEKTSKPHTGKSHQGHKHAANLSFKLIDSEPFTCVFCGRGSCYRDLSDLFGPYHPEGAGDDLVARRRASRESVSRVGSVGEDALPQEMWLHEDCAVWASGVYLVGHKLHGLDDAVSAAQQTVCSL